MFKENLGIFLLGFSTGFFSVGSVICGLYLYGKRKYQKKPPPNGETIIECH